MSTRASPPAAWQHFAGRDLQGSTSKHSCCLRITHTYVARSGSSGPGILSHLCASLNTAITIRRRPKQCHAHATNEFIWNGSGTALRSFEPTQEWFVCGVNSSRTNNDATHWLILNQRRLCEGSAKCCKVWHYQNHNHIECTKNCYSVWYVLERWFIMQLWWIQECIYVKIYAVVGNNQAKVDATGVKQYVVLQQFSPWFVPKQTDYRPEKALTLSSLTRIYQDVLNINNSQISLPQRSPQTQTNIVSSTLNAVKKADKSCLLWTSWLLQCPKGPQSKSTTHLFQRVSREQGKEKERERRSIRQLEAGFPLQWQHFFLVRVTIDLILPPVRAE